MGEKELIKFDDTKDLIDFLKQPNKIAEALTGILSSEVSTLKLSAGRLVQASIKFKLLSQLGRELQEYIEKGKIKEDYFASNNNQASLCELLKFIDEEIPDEERFKAMKSIFFASISKDISEKDEALAYELMQICNKLSSGDILILKAAYNITKGHLTFDYNGTINLNIGNAAEWLDLISKQLGHKISSLVEMHEDNLVKLKLISSRIHPDGSGVGKTPHFRLTKLGYELCEFITKP